MKINFKFNSKNNNLNNNCFNNNKMNSIIYKTALIRKVQSQLKILMMMIKKL